MEGVYLVSALARVEIQQIGELHAATERIILVGRPGQRACRLDEALMDSMPAAVPVELMLLARISLLELSDKLSRLK